ncbi:MAG: lysophospholipid acyltransferase family protein [Pseudomonadales bacterium]
MSDLTLPKPSKSWTRAARAAGVTAGYPFFALGCCVLAVLLAVSPLLVSRPTQRRILARRLAHHFARLFIWVTNRAALTDVRFEPLPPVEGTLLVANHPTLMDAIWLIARLPSAVCVLKADLERFRVLRFLVNRLGYLSNADPEKVLASACARLAAGETLLMFPEGTRTTPGAPLAFSTGAAEIALRSGAAVQTLVLHTRGTYLSKARPWWYFPDERIFWQLQSGPRFAPRTPAPAGSLKDQRAARRAYTAELQRVIQTALARPGHNGTN